MNKIVALVDGSIYSESVCEHAAWMSAQTKTPLEILHVLGRREAAEKQDLSGSIRLGARSQLLEELAELDAQRAKLITHRGRAILEDAQAIAETAGAVEITTRLRHGDVIESIDEMSDIASMLVVGKRGEAADFAKGHLGSNLERIVRAAHLPVLVAARAFKPIEKVLIAYDGGRFAMKAVDHISRAPEYAGLEVTVVTVGADTDYVQNGLKDAKALLSASGIAAETRRIDGNPEIELGKFIEEQGFDLLVMGAYGHSRIRTLVIGSTTSEMIRTCKVPVLLLR